MLQDAIITWYDTYLNCTFSAVVYDVNLNTKKEIYHYLRANGYKNVHPFYKLTIDYI